MQLPKGKYEVNVNTAIQIVGFLILVAGWGATWGVTRSDVESHTRVLGDFGVRLTAVEREQAVLPDYGVRLGAVEREQAKLPNLEYRIGQQEQGAASLARSVDDLKAAVSSQGTDLKVIREILTRLEDQFGETTRTSVRP